MYLPQDDRLLRVDGEPFSGNDVILTSLSGHEAMSRLYSYQLEIVSEQLNLAADKLIGQPLKIQIDSDAASTPLRYIHGYVSSFTVGETSDPSQDRPAMCEYSITLVPWLWFLSQTARCFIYFPEKEKKSVYDIIMAVFDRAKKELHITPSVDPSGITDLASREIEHCVQYRETDFNFVSRIMEQYGVYYYFTQTDSEHTLVLSTGKNYPAAAQPLVEYPTEVASGKAAADHVHSWQRGYEFVSGKWTHSDYNFTAPSAKMIATVASKDKIASKYEIYDYPGEYDANANGTKDAEVRQEEEEIPKNAVQASSSVRVLMPGHTFELVPCINKSLKSHSIVGAEKGTYLVTSIQHHANQPSPFSGGGSASYSNSFSCVPDSVQFRAARLTPKPVVSGIQTAVVVGPKGEEIYTDKYGRIMIAFHWDRENADRENSDRTKIAKGEQFYCWVRVAQNIAGNGWGFMAIPRIGQEVVVDFIEGDPDRPLVIGGVYNEEQMPHYDPEEEKTKTYIKTNSSPGGEGHNELRFEDKKDKEQVYIHAERNMDVRVKNDSMELIYGNRHQIIGWEKDGEKGGSQKEEIKKDRDVKVHANHTEQIGGDMKLLVGGGDGDGNQEIVVKKDKMELIEGESHEHVKLAKVVAVDGDRNTNIGGDQVLNVAGSSAHIAGKDHLMSGVNISIEGTAICLKSGGNSITINPSGVTIVGTLVRINSGPAPPVISQAAMLQSKAPTDATEAEPAEPTKADNSKSGSKSAPS